jgi:ribosomal protein S18 acetylase RimI-like enzyme
MNEQSIINLTSDYTEQAANILAKAFENYPVMRYVFSDKTDAEALACMQKMFQLSCTIRHTLGWPWLGCMVGDQLAGIAYVTPPELSNATWPKSLKELDLEFDAFIGSDALARFEQYDQHTRNHVPTESHFYLNCIGVNPIYKDQGLARPLLEAVHALAENHPTAIGVALSTENEKNVPLYEHFGYEVTAHSHIDKLQIWSMFRPK